MSWTYWKVLEVQWYGAYKVISSGTKASNIFLKLTILTKEQNILIGTKISPTGNFFIELYREHEDCAKYTFCIKNKYNQAFYNPLETDGEIDKDDVLDWSRHSDILFFSTNHHRHVFLFDLVHHQFYSETIKDGQKALWDDEGCQWLIREKEFSTGIKDYYSTVGELSSMDYMSNAPEQKIINISECEYCLWLQKHTIKTYDRKVWRISVYSKTELRLLVEDLGYYAVEDSIRIIDNNSFNFYGYTADNEALCVVNYRLKGANELYIWECTQLVPMRMDWIPEDKSWRAIINNAIIRPRPFYFDNLYPVELRRENKPIPLKLMDLIVKDNPEFVELREKYLQERSAAVKALHEEQNTSMEDLLRRASSGTQFFQRLKIRRLLSHKDNPKVSAIIYFIVATILIILVPVAAITAVANGWNMGGVALKNIATTIILLGVLWITSLTNLHSLRPKENKYSCNKRKIMIVVLIIIALLVGVLACVHAQKKEIVDYFEQSVSLCEKATGEADIQKALQYACKAADNGVNGVLFLLAEMYSGNPAPDILERNTCWYNTLQTIILRNDSIAFNYYKRCADAAEDSYCANIVAQWLIEGKGVEKNVQMAKEYQIKAQLFQLQE